MWDNTEKEAESLVLRKMQTGVLKEMQRSKKREMIDRPEHKLVHQWLEYVFLRKLNREELVKEARDAAAKDYVDQHQPAHTESVKTAAAKEKKWMKMTADEKKPYLAKWKKNLEELQKEGSIDGVP